MRKPPGTLRLIFFWLGKLQVEKVWAQNISNDFLAELDHSNFFVFVLYLQRALDLQQGQKKTLYNVSGRSLITFSISALPKTQFIRQLFHKK